MADNDDKQYTRLPVVLQTTAIKNFFEYTVEQLYSEANVETLNGFVGTPDWDGIRAEGAYIEEPTTTKQAYALSPTINTISPETGQPESLIFYDEVVDILKTYGVDVRNQNKLFDAPYFTFSPPINEDKLVNFSEYYWAPPGANVTPNAIIISGTVDSPVDVEEDILGKQYYVYYGETANVTFRNGMVVEFGNVYVTPEEYASNTFVVEGVGYEIDLVPVDRNSTAPYDPTEPNYVVIERGAVNNNGWSRNNYWFHVNNWYDADEVPPDRIYRAQRPIIEFDHRLETYNQGTNYLQSVDIAVTGYNYDQVNGLPANVEIDGVDPANKTLIFPAESTENAPYVYLAVPFGTNTFANPIATGQIEEVSLLQVEVAGEPGAGFVDKIIVLGQGSGYTPNTQIEIVTDAPITDVATAEAVIRKGIKVGISTSTTPTSLEIIDGGIGYQSNTIAISFTTDSPTGNEVEPVARPVIDQFGTITQIDVDTRGDNYDFNANISVVITDSTGTNANVIVREYDSYIQSVNVTNGGSGYTQFESIVLEPVTDVNVGDSVLITDGATQKGNEYYYTEQGWALANTKRSANDAPLFVMYDDTGTRLDDDAKYPQSDFTGNKIFSYATPEDIVDEDAASVATTLAKDPVLGFPLVYRPFKASSEIVFTNNLEHDKYTYTPLGGDAPENILGYNFYHLLPEGSDITDEYYPYWKPSDRPFNQAIVSRYQLSQIEIDRDIREFFIGCIPNVDTYNPFSGVDVKMYLNGKPVKGFTLNSDVEGFIRVNDNVRFIAGDYVELIAYSDTGLLSLQSASKYELPIGWDRNIFKENIRFTSEPEYLQHFKTQIESQIGFVGEPLGQNNYQSTAQDTSYATEIVQSDSDVILAGYLLDDQPHNLIDALRFNGGEYTKYKDRLKKTINDYYASQQIDENNIDRTLEMILREVIAFRVGKNVFNRTYVLPFGDNFFMEQQTIGGTADTIVLDSYLDLSLIEHSLLVFATPQGSLVTDMLVVDRDYVIESYNPITIRLIGDYLGSAITTKLYTSERDSAQCPPTPSVLGIYPLYQPEITLDDTFETPQQVLIGHDGSRTPTYGDARDQLLLDFEQRIYNAAKKEFREANSLPDLNFFDIRPGEFRNTGFGYVEWYNLMRYHFSTWASVNNTDPVTNEFYDPNNPWTWNYRGYSDTYPGHWRGLYEYYYDTVRPHTHPWEMLGFTEKPLWWDTEYGTDYGSGNDAMWNDLESGIIRQGPRENLTQNLWKLDTNPYAREYLFKYLPVDADGNLISPDKLPSGITDIDVEYESEYYDTELYPIFTRSFINPEADSVYPGITLSASNGNVYVESSGVLNYEPPPGRFEPQPYSVNLPDQFVTGPVPMPRGDSLANGGLIAIAVNGIPVMNPNSGKSESGWHYNEVFDGGYDYENPGKYDERGGYQYYVIPPKVFDGNATSFLEGIHSPIIGWALDGLPIYGPYGYANYNSDGSIADSNTVKIKSPFVLRSNRNYTGSPGGEPTGLFVEDYKVDQALSGNSGYAGVKNSPSLPDLGKNFAVRYGVTPESPSTPRWFYVQCEDDAGNPMFPYACGGGIQEHPQPSPVGAKYIYANQFLGTPSDANGVGGITVSDCGFGYTIPPGITLEGDGQGAEAYAITRDGVIRNVLVENPGKNYIWNETIIEILGDGTGATCEPVVIDGKITGVKMTNYGEGYTYATPIIKQLTSTDGVFPGQFAELTIPTVAQDPENGVVNGAVVAIEVTNPGYAYTYINVNINPALNRNGSGATAFATLESTYDNRTGNGYVDPDATPIVISKPITTFNIDKSIAGASWRYSDGAPVENAWKYSVSYPFAVAEGLLLGQPAQFATQFADPTKLFRAEVDSRQQLCTVTRERWQFTDPEQFRIHGERDAQGKFLTNIGYTQFINSWLAFQGLDTNIEFAPQLRTINMRLSHRMSGYVDKDTMTVRTDQYSATGTTPSLIIPQDNINIQVHSSPYKSRNFYTGVIIEKAAGGYKVRGFDRSVGTFPTLKIDRFSPSRGLTVGGEPAPYTQWEGNKFYKKGAIVEYRGVYYRAPKNITTSDEFNERLWFRLPSLPQINGATAEVWSKYLNQVDFVPYETLLKTPQEVVDLLMSLGAWQKNAGYIFEGFDYNTGDTVDWTHAAKQFLFWTTAKWEIGNTLELSPMAGGVTFEAPRGFIAKLNRIDRNQFTILSADGSAITPESCEIVRLDNYIQIKPSSDTQIYGVLLFVKEIEHAMTLENRTDFNDIIYDPVLHQYQTRVKIKGKRTADWTGKFSSDGFIVLDDELKPNLDNLAQSMGRYHELGFIPVEKQVYESARALFGYQSRAYLRDLDILDDQQFDFYKGFLQSKGTQTSMTRIGESNSIIINGEITVYDEWAVSVGEFGDVEAEQAIEFKLDRSNVTSDPQLVTLVFPEDVTGVVERVDVINRNNTYNTTPEVIISPPLVSNGLPAPNSRQATAKAYLRPDGKLDYIEMTEKGRGYEFATASIITQGNNSSGAGSDLEFSDAVAIGGLSDKAWSEQPINGNCWINTRGNTIQFTEMTLTDDDLIITPSNVSLFTPSTDVVFVEGQEITITGQTGNICKSDGLTCANLGNLNGTFTITSTEVTTAGTFVEFTADYKVGYPATYGVNIAYTSNNSVMFEFNDVYYHEANILVTPFEWGGKFVEDIINAETGNTGVTASMYASHVPNNRQPGQSGGEVIDWYTLVLRSESEFELIEESPSNVWSDQFHISTGTYRNQQRWAIDVASGTEAEDITVFVNGQIVDQCKYYEITPDGAVTGNCAIYNWDYLDGGEYTGNANVALVDQTLVYSLGAGNMAFLETYSTDPWVTADLDDTTSGVLVNDDYPFLELHVGNVKIEPKYLTYHESENVLIPTWITVWQVDTTNPGLIVLDTKWFPTDVMDPVTGHIIADLPIRLLEKASIKFTEDFNGDLNGSTISINVTADDDLLCKIGRERTYEVTKDITNDDIIVIDVDDPTRFLKKPTGEMTNQLWPTYNDVNYLGVKDSKDYPIIPNAGYVNSSNVNFQAYDIASLPLLFDPSVKIKPAGGHTIHVASSENSDWNVYELKPIQSDIQFLARQDDRVSLFTNYSLFNYIDGNMIGSEDTGRYLDYYLTMRNADVSDNVIVWTNETIIQQAQSTVEDMVAPRMIEARIRSIGPSEISTREFTNYLPTGDEYYNNALMSPSGLDQGQRRIVTSSISNVTLFTNEPVYSTTDPNTELTIVEQFMPLEGSGAEFQINWNSAQDGNVWVSTAANVAILNAGNNYSVGDILTLFPANVITGSTEIRVDQTALTERGFERSNVITIGNLQNCNIQEGDAIRIVNGGGYVRASVDISDIDIDYVNLSISFANVSNAQDFPIQGTMYVSTEPTTSSFINNLPLTVLENHSNALVVASGSLSTPELISQLEIGSFGSTNNLRCFVPYDFADQNITSDTNTFYIAFNVRSNVNGVKTLQIERPNTYFEYNDVTSEILDIEIRTGIQCVANVTANVFTAGSDAIGIEGYSGNLQALNGLWPIFNVVPSLNNPDRDLVYFNAIRTLPSGTFAGPPTAYITKTAIDVNLIHLNKTRLVFPNVKDIRVGDNIKVLADNFSGTYNVDSVVMNYNVSNDDTFEALVDIPTPYLFNSNRTGTALLGGMKITTTNPHGISKQYAKNNKRIAVHFAYPKSYNRIYTITDVDAYNIYIDEVLTQTGETIEYYRYETCSVSRNDNVYVSLNDSLMTRTTAYYASNSSVIAPNEFTEIDGTITFNPSTLPSSGEYVTINIIREIDRSYDRYPVLTTMDHNKIRLNGVNFTINSYNNKEAVVENINRAASLMRGWVTPAGSGMTFSFPMLKDYRTPVFAPDGSMRPAHTINNYGPYIRDKNTLARIQNDPDMQTGVISLANKSELIIDNDFNKGAIKVGPTKGATYYDQEEHIWKIWLQEGPTDTQGGYYPIGAYYNDINRKVLPKRPKTFKNKPDSHVNGGAILEKIPGSYRLQRNNPDKPGQTQYEYDMNAVKQYKFPPIWVNAKGQEVVPEMLAYLQDNPRPAGTVKMFRYRLKPSTLGYYEVYENVELTDGEIIAIKVDSAIPSFAPHDYFNTQSTFGNFYGISSNSINFDSKVSFDSSKVELYPSYSGGSIVLGPVTPPADIGRTLIPEPFAIRRSGVTMGNGTDAVLNWESLPFIEVKRIGNSDNYKFVMQQTGFDLFDLWQPGLVPGKLSAPVNLSTSIGKPFGKGTGYYERGDGNVPESFQVISTKDDMVDAYDYGNITMGWADPRNCFGDNPWYDCQSNAGTPTNDYPMISSDGWSGPQARFKYSKRFTIDPNTSNDDSYNIENDYANSSVYFNSQESRYAYKTFDEKGNVDVNHLNSLYTDQANKNFRPDEIFVACFWTEPHTYTNQIINYKPDPQNAGNRMPVRKDYQGTITRCKYIRLTEMPLDAVLVKPECDTGWGGLDPSDSTASSGNGGTGNRSSMTAMADDLLETPQDETAGTSATQNENYNTGSRYTGGTTEENPDANEQGAYDQQTRFTLPGGYESVDNTLVEPGEQVVATLPNDEARAAVGTGVNATGFSLNAETSLLFSRNPTAGPGGETPFDNSGTGVNQNIRQNTDIQYPTIENVSSGTSSPVLNPPQVILPGPCDIGIAPGADVNKGSGSCQTAKSIVQGFSASNNYYGMAPEAKDWKDVSNDKEIPKYEWHNFGKLANLYKSGTKAYIEVVCDFRDDTLTAAGLTIVQSRTPFGENVGGQTFNPRLASNSSAVNRWWETAKVIGGLNTTPGEAQSNGTPEGDMLLYGKDAFDAPYTPEGRATADNIPMVSRIGLSKTEGRTYNVNTPAKKPSNFGENLPASAWLCSDVIIGGTNKATPAKHNAVKGAFGFRQEVDCGNGEYITAFVHIGHGSGKIPGSADDALYGVPRYDIMVIYNHNVDSYGSDDSEFKDACGDGTRPKSAGYTGGAMASAWISANRENSTQEYIDGAVIRAGNTAWVKYEQDYKGTIDRTGLLEQGDQPSWLFDNIYFPYNPPIRRGEEKAASETQGDPDNSNALGYCCNPADPRFTSVECFALRYTNPNLCNYTGGGTEAGGAPSGGESENPGFGAGEKHVTKDV